MTLAGHGTEHRGKGWADLGLSTESNTQISGQKEASRRSRPSSITGVQNAARERLGPESVKVIRWIRKTNLVMVEKIPDL